MLHLGYLVSVALLFQVKVPLVLMDILTEGAKEVIFGGLAGLTAGFISKKVGSHLVGAALGSGFVLFRAAVYDGNYVATWSPLAKDDPSFSTNLKRKIKKEGFSTAKRLEDFTQENLLIMGGFVGAYMMGSAR